MSERPRGAVVRQGDGPATSVAIVFGAAHFPAAPELDSEDLARAFSGSQSAMLNYLRSICSEVLDAFDTDSLPNELGLAISDFLTARQTATDVILYYVGHGGFFKTQEYYLAVRRTKSHDKRLTTFRLADLAGTIVERLGPGSRCFMILDCCFAAGAVPFLFQGDAAGGVLAAQARKLPHGVALLAASSKDEAAIVPSGESVTMFSGALLKALLEGSNDARYGHELSLRELGDLTAGLIEERFREGAVRPEVHSPVQRDGDPAEYAIFPNFARRALEQAIALQRVGSAQRGAVADFPSLPKAGEAAPTAPSLSTTAPREFAQAARHESAERRERTRPRLLSPSLSAAIVGAAVVGATTAAVTLMFRSTGWTAAKPSPVTSDSVVELPRENQLLKPQPAGVGSPSVTQQAPGALSQTPPLPAENGTAADASTVRLAKPEEKPTPRAAAKTPPTRETVPPAPAPTAENIESDASGRAKAAQQSRDAAAIQKPMVVIDAGALPLDGFSTLTLPAPFVRRPTRLVPERPPELSQWQTDQMGFDPEEVCAKGSIKLNLTGESRAKLEILTISKLEHDCFKAVTEKSSGHKLGLSDDGWWFWRVRLNNTMYPCICRAFPSVVEELKRAK